MQIFVGIIKKDLTQLHSPTGAIADTSAKNDLSSSVLGVDAL